MNKWLEFVYRLKLEFSYLVNNAGVMCFGEFEWQTNAIIEHQVNVNLFGTMNFTRSFLPLARKHKTRIINVTSHCAIEVNIHTSHSTDHLLFDNFKCFKIYLQQIRHYLDYQHMQLRKLVYVFGMMHYVSKCENMVLKLLILYQAHK